MEIVRTQSSRLYRPIVPVLLWLLFFVLNAFSAEAREVKRVGILVWGSEPRYDITRNGVLDQLRKEGFKEPAVKFSVEYAEGKKARAAEVVEKFAGQKMDLVVALGTSAAAAVAGRIKDLPVVYTVYDPVESNLARDWESSGNNTTGAAAKVSMTRLLGFLQAFTPVRKLAVLYTPGQKNSEAALKDLAALQADSRVSVLPVPLVRDEEVAQLLPEVIRTADAIYLTGSSVVGRKVLTVVELATKAKVATITHLDDLVDQGVLLGVAANQYQLGRLAGKKGAMILRGAKPSSIPIEALKKPDLIINMKTARAGNFKVPPAFIKLVTKVVK